MKKDSKYMDRALQSRDPRFAKILGKLGYNRRDMRAEESDDPPISPEEELKILRAKYKEVFGRNAYYGWDIEALKTKLEGANNA